MKLINKSWYRDLFPKQTFVKEDGRWVNYKNYKGGKITSVSGKFYNLTFCKCGNELIHSNSFIEERVCKNETVWDYKCTHCGKISHYNPDIIPGLIECNVFGIPLRY